jgi:hypothetical protein
MLMHCLWKGVQNFNFPNLLVYYSNAIFTLIILLQADSELVKFDIHCHIQGDVVLECISLDDDLEREEMMFRVMFNTAFIRSNILMLNCDEIDVLWNAKDRFPKDFRAEVLIYLTYFWFNNNFLV